MYLPPSFAAVAPSQKSQMASSARIDELRTKFEENPRRYFAPLANEYRKAGETDQAIAICREYLPQQPGHMSGHIVYGQALYESRQFEEAKTVFETALSLDPENLIALRHLGDIALIVGDSAGARTWYGRVLEADPRNEEIQAQLQSLDQLAAANPPSAGMPTPSSVPTVVVSVVQRPQMEPTLERPVPATPVPAPTPHLGDSPTAEIVLDQIGSDAPLGEPKSVEVPAPPAAPEEKAIGFEPTSPARDEGRAARAVGQPPVELDSPASAARAALPIDSSSLAGLETTSLVAAPQQATPEPAAQEPPASASPTQDLPMLDLGESSAAPAPTAVPEIAESGPFVTETMAELYLQQGHRDEALRVYRALLEQRPDDAQLLAKLTGLERAAPSRSAEPVSAPALPTAPPLPPPSAAAEPTIKELLGIVVSRRPGQRIPAAPGENGSPPASIPAAPASTAPAPQARSDMLAALFGSSGVSEEEEGAAMSLALAFGAGDGAEKGRGQVETHSIQGNPARRASKDFSLDSVFGGGSGESKAVESPSSFSFDQFFSQRATAEHPVQSGSGAAGGGTSGGTESRDDVAKFTQWLEGLKQR